MAMSSDDFALAKALDVGSAVADVLENFVVVLADFRRNADARQLCRRHMQSLQRKIDARRNRTTLIIAVAIHHIDRNGSTGTTGPSVPPPTSTPASIVLRIGIA